ncbi:MAG TPA: DUF6526 family protein, partial [Gemmatimonadaceae bacterium]
MAAEQSYRSHTRYHPWHHFVVLPILAINFGTEVSRLIDNPSGRQAWQVVVAFALVIFSFTARGMALKAQDRVIRLEERMRLNQLMPGQATAIESLRPGQLIALRFAPDDEVPGLFERIVSGDLKTSKEIKQAIKVW